MIPQFLEKWEEGYKVVLGQKKKSKENILMFQVRKLYYRIMNWLSDTPQYEGVTGYGLFDKEVLETIGWMDDPDPYIRGLVPELGYRTYLLAYIQNKRQFGKSSYNFNKYFDFAITGVTHVSRKPLRIATMLGFIMSGISFFTAFLYLIMKLIWWDRFAMGTAPILIGIFLLASIQLAFIGVIGEYVGAILTRVTKRPMVVEEERINF